MRRFSSYGPVDTDLHFHAPRTVLVDRVLAALAGGGGPENGGGYITVWAPRQRGKSWIVGQAVRRLRDDPRHRGFDVVATSVEHLKTVQDAGAVIRRIAADVAGALGLDVGPIRSVDEFDAVFRAERGSKPLILVLDEFDALPGEAIEGIVGVFRKIHGHRRLQAVRPGGEMDYRLHGVALIGVRGALGVDSATGSPFNVQQSVHVPNLTEDEVGGMFAWYERESGQRVESAVVERVYRETGGQPGLTSWLGELLTETYNRRGSSITVEDFDAAYADAVDALPNANVQHLIGKVREAPYRDVVLDFFQTGERRPFHFDEPHVNFLYLNGVVDREPAADGRQYVRFSCPFVQKRLFNYFSSTLAGYTGSVFTAFEDVSDTITDAGLDIRSLLRRFERHLRANREWLLRDAPRRRDLRVFEAVHHFVLYSFLDRFLQPRGGRVYPEFPAGNGAIDLLIRYAGKAYGLEVKSFTDAFGYRRALGQAARYGRQLGLDRVTLVFFVDAVDDANRGAYEAAHVDEAGVTVDPVFVETA